MGGATTSTACSCRWRQRRGPGGPATCWPTRTFSTPCRATPSSTGSLSKLPPGKSQVIHTVVPLPVHSQAFVGSRGRKGGLSARQVRMVDSVRIGLVGGQLLGTVGEGEGVQTFANGL